MLLLVISDVSISEIELISDNVSKDSSLLKSGYGSFSSSYDGGECKTTRC